MNSYVEENLKKFDYYNNPNWISLDKLVNLISEKALEWYELFVIDTFSRIEWNLNSQTARTSQNKCMETLQEMAQRLDIAIIVLHHTNRQWTFEGSQKIMDLSNMFIIIEKDIDWEWEEYRRYKLMKDKFTTNQEVELYYHGWKYEF
jgi:predicted ATP-dependent serine protease